MRNSTKLWILFISFLILKRRRENLWYFQFTLFVNQVKWNSKIFHVSISLRSMKSIARSFPCQRYVACMKVTQCFGLARNMIIYFNAAFPLGNDNNSGRIPAIECNRFDEYSIMMAHVLFSHQSPPCILVDVITYATNRMSEECKSYSHTSCTIDASFSVWNP